MAILAIDQGTTSTRGFLLDPSATGEEPSCTPGQIIASQSHQQYYPKPGWVEHDPEELIRNIQYCIDQSHGAHGIGIDNQGESCLAWDKETKIAISPVIVWQDNRSQHTIERLKSEGHEALILARSGLPLDAYFSASKLAWILKNIPEADALLKRNRLRLGTTDAFFLDRLTGRFVTDITTASRTSLMNIHTGQWDQTLCDLFEVPIQALPQIVPTTYDFGSVQSNGQWIPITASLVDQQASLYGHGCRQQGDMKITFGTGAFALSLTGETLQQAPEQGLLPTIAWQQDKTAPIYALDGGVYCAGSAVNWAKTLGLFSQFSEINAFDRPHAIERELVFVPALSGLACPHWDRRAAGMWIGLTLDTTPSDMMQSLLEGIAYRAWEVISAMSTLNQGSVSNPQKKPSISIDGGLSANPYFCQFLANLVNQTIIVPNQLELTALGTALLAASHPNAQVKNPASLHMAQSDTDNGRIYYPNRPLADVHPLFHRAIERCKNWSTTP